jgi:uracil-DNA glycosylase
MSDNPQQPTNEAAALLHDIELFLKDEQALFGEFLLSEQSTISSEPAMTLKKPVVAEEPVLFELPPVTAPPLTTEAWGSATSLDAMNAQICNCTKCGLGHTRTKFVFGVGNPNATLMLVGEAPGADEDAQGEPFVGRAGQLLNKILEAIQFKREDVYICNILKCRPPGNRKPQPDEVELCIPYLKKQIQLVKPKVILCLGLTAAENLLGTTESLGKLRGRVMQYEGTPLMVTYHPAALLRNPNWKRPAWEDVQAVRKLHDELVAKG